MEVLKTLLIIVVILNVGINGEDQEKPPSKTGGIPHLNQKHVPHQVTKPYLLLRHDQHKLNGKEELPPTDNVFEADEAQPLLRKAPPNAMLTPSRENFNIQTFGDGHKLEAIRKQWKNIRNITSDLAQQITSFGKEISTGQKSTWDAIFEIVAAIVAKTGGIPHLNQKHVPHQVTKPYLLLRQDKHKDPGLIADPVEISPTLKISPRAKISADGDTASFGHSVDLQKENITEYSGAHDHKLQAFRNQWKKIRNATNDLAQMIRKDLSASDKSPWDTILEIVAAIFGVIIMKFVQ